MNRKALLWLAFGLILVAFASVQFIPTKLDESNSTDQKSASFESSPTTDANTLDGG